MGGKKTLKFIFLSFDLHTHKWKTRKKHKKSSLFPPFDSVVVLCLKIAFSCFHFTQMSTGLHVWIPTAKVPPLCGRNVFFYRKSAPPESVWRMKIVKIVCIFLFLIITLDKCELWSESIPKKDFHKVTHTHTQSKYRRINCCDYISLICFWWWWWWWWHHGFCIKCLASGYIR